MHIGIEITFLSDWHVSGGIGDGHLADAMLVRDAGGLPHIPGRAVKGALREGAHRLALCRPDLLTAEERIWGTRSEARFTNTPGMLSVTPALLPEDMRRYLLSLNGAEKDLFVRDLTVVRRQTALNADRTARASSLRSIECGIPGMTFRADVCIEGSIPETWLKTYLRVVCAAVKSIGGGRSRGLGRCRVVIAGERSVPVTLPSVFQGGAQ